ncbi:MAG: hypothetical protein JOZ27_09650, partial [Caulobacteraceae bacterium]|nr:hypothetical protein [Caulobacteraceae bacterium]
RRLTQAGVNGGVTTATATISKQIETPPLDLGVLLNMSILDPISGDWTPIELVTPFGESVLAAMREASPAIPDRVALVGAALQFSPVPDQSYQVSIQYVATFAALSAGNPSNWILSTYPDVYLYGVLSQAAGYFGMGLDSQVSTWRTMFDTACAETVDAERRKRGPMFTPAFRASDAPPNYGRRRYMFDIRSGL